MRTMKEKNKPVEQELPDFIKKAPELLPVYDWWVKEGKSTLVMLAVGAVCVGAFYGVRNWMDKRNQAANNALVQAFTTEDLESAVADYGSTKVGTALKYRLAKSYFDGDRFQEALDTYKGLLGSNEAFVDIAEVGVAESLEGLKQYKEAKEAYVAYAGDASKTNSYLLLTAQLGSARCTALLGDKDAAVKELDALKAKLGNDEIAKLRIERLTDAVKRYDPTRQTRSLFDAANDAAEALATEKKEPAKVEVKPAAKPAEKK